MADSLAPSSEVTREALVEEAAHGILNARTEEGLVLEFVRRGVAQHEAAEAVQEGAGLVASARQARRQRGKSQMGIGVLAAGFGAFVTLFTMSHAEEGGSYLVAWGALVFGPIWIVRGVWFMRTDPP